MQMLCFKIKCDKNISEKMCIRFVYTYELPGYGQKFHPDEKHIYPTANQVCPK